MRRREDGEVDDVVRQQLAGERVEPADALDGVAPPLDPVAGLLVRREDLERVAVDAERPAGAADVVALVLDVHEPLHRELLRDVRAAVRTQDLALVLLRRAQAVDARDARDDQDVLAAQQGGRGGVAEPLDLVVDRRVLLDVGVRGRDVGLGLVVVVVAHEVLDGVVREDLAELVGELGAERLVGRDHEGRLLHLLDHVRDREGLARPGGAQEREVLLPRLDALGQPLDGGRLVAGGRNSDAMRNGGMQQSVGPSPTRRIARDGLR